MHRGSWLVVLLLIGLLPGVAGSALAGTLIVESGKVGRHDVTDSASAPGVICRFAPPLNWSLGETWLQVRPPMMFARDVTAGHDRQLVGWRAVVLAPDRETGGWQAWSPQPPPPPLQALLDWLHQGRPLMLYDTS